MEKRSRLRTLRARLNAIILLPILLFIVVGIIVSSLASRTLYSNRVVASQEASLRLQERFIDQWLEERAQDVRQMALLPQVRNGRPADADGAFRALLESQQELYAIVITNAAGTTIYDTSAETGLDVSDREYFQAARAGRSAMSDVIIGRASGNKIFIFAEPIRSLDTNAVVGVLFAPVLASAIDSVMEEGESRLAGETFLVDRSGLMLTRSEYEPRLRSQGLLKGESSVLTVVNRSPIVDRASTRQRDYSPYVSYSGMPVIGSYRWINNDQWLLISEQPVGNALAPYRQLELVFAGVGMGLVALSALIARRFARTIEIPARALAAASSQFFESEDEFELDEKNYRSAPKELQMLSDALSAMAVRIHADMELLARNSFTDALTGIYNRAYLEQEGTRVLKLCARSGQPCSAIMIDIDRFKPVNDQYGHAAGDDVLKVVTDTIVRSVRESDIVVRYGGEEFAVLVPDSTGAQTMELAERVRASVSRGSIEVRSAALSVTVSAGVSSILVAESPHRNLEISDLYDLIAHADDALYQAKRAGRDRVVLYRAPE